MCATVLIHSNTYAAAELLQEATTHFRVSPLLSPLVQSGFFSGKPLLTQNTAWAFGLGVEVPVLDWFSSGFIVQFNTGLPGLIPVTDLSGIAKFQWPFPIWKTGNCAPYILVPIGVTYTSTAVFDEVALHSASDPELQTKLYDYGVGFNGGISGGFEFFPIRYIGIYAEAGYRVAVLFHQIVKGPDLNNTWEYRSYWIRGTTVSFGAKIAF